MNEDKAREVFGMREVTNWQDINVAQLPMATIRHWLEHPEDMTMAQVTALQEYLARHSDVAARWGLSSPTKPEQGG
jgi:hypothetical protein